MVAIRIILHHSIRAHDTDQLNDAMPTVNGMIGQHGISGAMGFTPPEFCPRILAFDHNDTTTTTWDFTHFESRD